MTGTRAPVLDRLARRSEWQATPRSAEIGDCLVWMGGKVNKRGYGAIGWNGKLMSTHRAAYIARHGQPPPETPWILHRCDNPPCWRDEHLYAGTPADNNRDTLVRGRNNWASRDHCSAGHPYDEANTRRYKTRRLCRACNRDQQNRRRAIARRATCTTVETPNMSQRW